MTTVYLHIGNPKTGTSAIQYFFYKHRKAFLKQSLLYPTCGERNGKEMFAHINLAEALIKERDTEDVEDKHRAKIDEWETIYQEINALSPGFVLISAENLAKLTFEEIAWVKNYLSDFTVKIIIYLRRQDKFLLSSYSQQVKLIRYLGSVKEYYTEFKGRCDYYRLLESWRRVFGRENIIVRIFEPSQFKNGVIGDFFECLDLQPEESQFKFSEKKNVNPNEKVIQVINFLNKLTVKWLSISPEICQKLLIRHFSKNGRIADIISKIPDWLISNNLLSDHERKAIVQEFEASNRKVAQEYLERLDGQLFNVPS